MFVFKGVKEQLNSIDPSRRSSQTPATPSPTQEFTMGNNSSMVAGVSFYPELGNSPEAYPYNPGYANFSDERVIYREDPAASLAGSPATTDTNMNDESEEDNMAETEVENMAETESESESEEVVVVDSDVDMGADDDYGSHHSDLDSIEPSHNGDRDSDAASHPSGIGSERSVHTDPEDLFDEYDPEYIPDEMPGEVKVDYFLNTQKKVRLDKRDVSGWHQAEISLFDELDLRGTQPLMPNLWRGDFPTCPDVLFSGDYDQTYLNSMIGAEFQGARALRELLKLGSTVRSVLTGSRTREKVIARGIKEYNNWAEKDGCYFNKKYTPILVVTAGKPGQSFDTITQKTERDMQMLATFHRAQVLQEEGDPNFPAKFFVDPPLIYGVMIAGTKVIFVTLASKHPDDTPRAIADFDFNDPTMDVWNSFAIAILITATRNWLAEQLKDAPNARSIEDVDA